MLLVSRHLTDYWHFPASIFTVRVNLAWETSMVLLREHLAALPADQNVFLDIPLLRRKPPCTEWRVGEIIEMATEFPCIRYVGISRVEAPEHLMTYIVKLPNVAVVPKIESIAGCRNIKSIAHVLTEPKIVMLDHDDLFHDILDKGLDPAGLYDEHITPLRHYCRQCGIRLLRTAGVMFADHLPPKPPTARLVLAELCSHAADVLTGIGEHKDVNDLAASLRCKANELRFAWTDITGDQ